MLAPVQRYIRSALNRARCDADAMDRSSVTKSGLLAIVAETWASVAITLLP